MRINRRVRGLAAVACLAMTAAACGGEGGEEAVFLYFIHGYPGSGSMSVNSNRGQLVNGVPFGERYGANNTSCGPDAVDCLPVRVERQFGSEFSVRLENMPEPADITKEVFAMYPHETGTVVLTRRSGTASVDTTLLRHVQSISSDCQLTMVNGLAVDNQYLSLGEFSITPEIFSEDISEAGFGNEAQTPFISECGALPVDDPTHTNLQRPAVLQAVQDDPWFLLACDGENGLCKLRWGLPSADDRVRIQTTGAFPTVRDSLEYTECIQAALSIRAPEDAMTPVFPGAEVDCPPVLTWADIDVDAQAIEECNKPIIDQTPLLQPGQSDTTQSFGSLGGGDDFFCDMRFRIRNGGQDIIFGPRGNDALGSHGDGAPIESEVNVPDGAQRFYVMLGRPVNPIIWQWDSSETFVDLGAFPYFNEGGDRPVVGENDR